MKRRKFPMLFYASAFVLVLVFFVTVHLISENIPADDICPLMPVEGNTCVESNPNNQLAIRLFVLKLFGGLATAIFAAIFFVHFLWANVRNSGSGL